MNERHKNCTPAVIEAQQDVWTHLDGWNPMAASVMRVFCGVYNVHVSVHILEYGLLYLDIEHYLRALAVNLLHTHSGKRAQNLCFPTHFDLDWVFWALAKTRRLALGFKYKLFAIHNRIVSANALSGAHWVLLLPISLHIPQTRGCMYSYIHNLQSLFAHAWYSNTKNGWHLNLCAEALICCVGFIPYSFGAILMCKCGIFLLLLSISCIVIFAEERFVCCVWVLWMVQ